MTMLTAEEIGKAAGELSGWTVVGKTLERSFRFVDFVGAIRFVNGAATMAEEMGHHPDMDIRYNRVKVSLTTHDAGGLTALDFALARRLDGLEGIRAGIAG